MTVDHLHEGPPQSEIHLASKLDFVIFTVTLSLLSKADLAVMITSKNITKFDFTDHSHQSNNTVCIERPPLLYNTMEFFCPTPTPSKSKILQILSSAQITTDTVSTYLSIA